MDFLTFTPRISERVIVVVVGRLLAHAGSVARTETELQAELQQLGPSLVTHGDFGNGGLVTRLSHLNSFIHSLAIQIGLKPGVLANQVEQHDNQEMVLRFEVSPTSAVVSEFIEGQLAQRTSPFSHHAG